MNLGRRLAEHETAAARQGRWNRSQIRGPVDDLRDKTREALVHGLSKKLGGPERTAEQLRQMVSEELERLIVEASELLTREERDQLAANITDDVLGYGPIEPLLADPTISEVMVNGTDSIYIERNGRIELSNLQFRTVDHLRQVIVRIAASMGRRIDESSPMVDARLADGSRVNAVIPPLAVDGPVLTIRKFAADTLSAEDLIKRGSLSAQALKFLTASVRGQLNILVSGGTGTGKTTFLNVLSGFIPADDRIVTIEDAVELKLRQRHVIRLETRPPNIEGKGAVGIRELVRNSLRMRPDRIIVGECRGAEALDMLQAMNTGHDGSLGTVHANSPQDALSRMETMVLMGGVDLPMRAVREQLASAVDLVVQLERLREGDRVVTFISEVTGLDNERIVLNDLYTRRFDQAPGRAGRTGVLVATGKRPTVASKLAKHGEDVQDLFAVQLA
jgi:pilus assembly protein CpaF